VTFLLFSAAIFVIWTSHHPPPKSDNKQSSSMCFWFTDDLLHLGQSQGYQNPLTRDISRNTMHANYLLVFALHAAVGRKVDALSLSVGAARSTTSRRSFLATAASAAGAVLTQAPLQHSTAQAATPTINKLNSGVKYAILKEATKGSYPQQGDIVAIEYTGYLTSGTIFDGTHSEGKQNALLFKLGSTAVIPGINEMVAEMKVGQKVQAIIPPELAFGQKGICLEDGECLVKPGATLVYDVYLKKASIPPP
jgi:FKBP-type peptidyl-prolyl cis-trans isomerase